MATQEQEKTEEIQEQSSPAPVKKKQSSSPSTLVILAFIAIMLCIPMGLIRFNIIGAGDILRPFIQPNSFFAKFLPPSKNNKDINLMNRTELIKLINENNKKIKTLENTIKQDQEIAEEYTGTVDGFAKFEDDKRSLETQLAQIQSQKDALKNDEQSLAEKIAKQDTAGFKAYYESMNKDLAKQIYTGIIKDEKASKEIQDFVTYYNKMTPASAAQIFNTMADSDITLVANIIKNMDQAQGTKILQAMDSIKAARITDILGKQVPLK